MRKLIRTGITALALFVPSAAQADTATPKYYVSCGTWYMTEPHRCDFAKVEQAAHHQMTPIMKMRWRSWGGATAHARGTFFYNSGYRAPARITLYRPIQDDEGDFIYTRIKGVLGRGCTAVIDGKRWCDPVGHKNRFRSRLVA